MNLPSAFVAVQNLAAHSVTRRTNLMSVSFSFDSGGHTALVQPVGEHDVATAALLRRVLLEDCIQAQLIVIDFGRTTFIDSTILAVIVAAHKRLGERDGRVVGVNASPQVLKVLRITGIDALLQMQSDLQDFATLALRLAPVATSASVPAEAVLSG